jgi:hypothetical protein
VLEQEYRLLFGSTEADAGGPVRIVEEFRRGFEPAGRRGLRAAAIACAWLWFLLALFDLVRAVRLARALRRGALHRR